MARGETSSTDNTWLDLPPTARQTRWAIAVTAVVLAGFIAVIPVATASVGRAQRVLSLPRRDRVRQRSRDRGFALCAVCGLALARPARACHRISVHGADRHPACAHLRGRFFAGRTARREHPNRLVALHLLAHRLCGCAARLRDPAGRKAWGTSFERTGAACGRLERGKHDCGGVRADLACD